MRFESITAAPVFYASEKVREVIQNIVNLTHKVMCTSHHTTPHALGHTAMYLVRKLSMAVQTHKTAQFAKWRHSTHYSFLT